jgi:hypothetical protein
VDHLARGYNPAEIHFQYPYLSLAHIHAALSYNFANQKAIDDEIAHDEAESDALFAERPATVTRESLSRRLESSM